MEKLINQIPNEEIIISGQYGGEMGYTTFQEDKIIIETSPEYITTIKIFKKYILWFIK